jgi:hypothetical protein
VTVERIIAIAGRILTKLMVTGIGTATESRASVRETETGIKAEKGEVRGTMTKIQKSANTRKSIGTVTGIARIPRPAHLPPARGKLRSRVLFDCAFRREMLETVSFTHDGLF